MLFIRFALLLSASALFAQTNSTADPALPAVVHVCFAGCGRGEGMTLFLENGRYVDKDAQGVAAAYDIVKFTKDAVVMTRNDFRPRPAHATLTGRISPEGNALVEGKAHWSETTINPFQMAWGEALDVVPGDRSSPSAIPACDAQVTATVAQAVENGAQAMDRKKWAMGLCWFRIAAAQGDHLGEGALATIYYKGLGVPVDYKEAMKFATLSANARNYVGEDCLYLIYLNGSGVPKNPDKAEMYRQLRKETKKSPFNKKRPTHRDWRPSASSNPISELKEFLGCWI